MMKLTAKNALFAGHDEGARSWGRIGSLIETCKMNGVEPYAWLNPSVAENFHWRVRSARYLSGLRSYVPCSLGSPSVTLNHSLLYPGLENSKGSAWEN